MNRSPLALFSAVLILLLPSSARCGGEWLGGQGAIYAIKTVERNGPTLHGPEITVADDHFRSLIYVGVIRRERASGGTVAATAAELRPGVRVKLYGGFGTSPSGFIAQKILIIGRK